MSKKTTITDAARQCFNSELEVYYYGNGQPEQGHFVQQLLDAEGEKWEKKYNQAIEDICCQNAEAVEKDKQERDQLRQQLTEAQAAIAVKDEALNKTKQAIIKLNGCYPLEYCAPEFLYKREACEAAEQALSPNCGQPLIELVRAQTESLTACKEAIKVLFKRLDNRREENQDILTDVKVVAAVLATDAALTKAKQLGF